MTSSKLLLLAAVALLGGCAVDHADIPPAGAGKTLSDVPPSQDRDLGAGSSVALPTPGEEVRVYVAGGVDPNGVPHAEVFSAALHTDGSLGAWRAEAKLPAATTGLSLARTGSSILAFGGGDVLAAIDGEGGVAHWRAVSSGASLANAGVTTDGSSLLVLGGVHDGRTYPVGLVASLGDSGMPGTFAPTTELPSARSHVGAARLGKTVFAVGGTSETGDAMDEVLAGRVLADGSVAEWKAATSLPHALTGHGVAAAGDSLFVLGGRTSAPERDVFVSRVADDGSLGGWKVAGALPRGLEGHCVVASGATIFVIGGETDSARATDDVLATTVNMDGSLGAWRKLTSLPFPLSGSGCAVR